jgi:DNA gyrase subunit B
MAVMTTIRRMSKRWSPEVLEQLIYMPELQPAQLRNGEPVRGWCTELASRLNADHGADGVRFEVQFTPDASGGGKVSIIEHLHGIASARELGPDFFGSGEYRSMTQLGKKLDGLIGAGAQIQRGERRQAVSTFKRAFDWMMEEAKRGQQIQRYKGLGEMNPEQLWETTMNIETRRLLKVQIEDAVAADQIFTTLMGDQVEPRREFIEQHALSVANLDV